MTFALCFCAYPRLERQLGGIQDGTPHGFEKQRACQLATENIGFGTTFKENIRQERKREVNLLKKLNSNRGPTDLRKSTHSPIVVAFSPIEKWTRLFEEPFFGGTPEICFERLVARRGPELFSARTPKTNLVSLCLDLPDTHGFPPAGGVRDLAPCLRGIVPFYKGLPRNHP
ncbi:MAG: hypothetical protein JRI36_03805 [Deltaproteobacteria bacterium]|nr:hypothetical protein [Deltaproteobacteria bacterium]